MGARKLFSLEDSFYFGGLCESESDKKYTELSKSRNSFKKTVGNEQLRQTNLSGEVSKVIQSSEVALSPNIIQFPFLFNTKIRLKLFKSLKELGLTQLNAARLIGISPRSLSSYLVKEKPVRNSKSEKNIESYLKLYDLLRGSIEIKYLLRKVLNSESDLFEGLTAIDFAEKKGDLGLINVIGILRRIYA